MIVLSLCDGMSCGRLAFQKAGIPVEKYFAAEIKDIAIKVTMNNFPDTIQIGDVNKVRYESGVLHTEKGSFETPIDIVIFGSPCQTFSVAMKSELRVGLENKEKSGLFLQCYRVLKEVNPKFFFMENVARMKQEDKDFITNLMGVQPIKINSSLLSAQRREREYWTNIPNVEQPKDKGIQLQSILTSGFVDREKSRALLVSDSRPLTTKERMLHRYKETGFTTLVWEEKGNDETVRYFNQTELERLQTVPEGYTKCLTRNEAANVLGDGWTVDVIAHIFSNLKGEKAMIKDMDDKDFEANEVALFDSQYLAVFQQLANVTAAKKKLEAEEKKVKEAIQKAMDEYGIKSIDNDYIKITRVAAGVDKTTVDLDAFAKAEPKNYAELLADYPKTVKGKAGYVMFKVKGA